MRILFIVLFLVISVQAKDYTKKPEVKRFINSLVRTYKMDRGYLLKLFSNVKKYHMPIRKYRKKHRRTHRRSKYGTWDRYSRLKVNPSRVRQGVRYIQRHKKIFDDVEKKYGVPKEYIAAIIGVETVYGGNVGKYPVFDNLVMLAFEKNRRNKFFKNQLKKFLHLSKTQKFNPKNVKGSYAGAIGLVQFIPSNYEHYGVDYDKDGKIRLQTSADAIASVANYFKKNGWRRGEPVAARVKYEGTRFTKLKTGYKKAYNRASLGKITPYNKWDYKGKVRLIKLNRKNYDELWYGAKNFFVITRYNHSAYYAMSIHLLAQKIKARL